MKLLLLLSSLALICCDTSPLQTSESSSNSSGKQKNAITYRTLKHSNTTLHYLSFSDKGFRIEVADQKNGPGTLWQDARAAAKAKNALAAINAGFFTPEGKPLGICIEKGLKTGHLNKSSLGSGAYILTSDNKAKIIRRAQILKQKKPKFLLQAGPFLVENKKAIKVKQSEARPRSFIAWDGKNQWVIGHVESITMPALVTMLKTIEIPGFHLHTALNLDGGRSCQLYVGASATHSEKQITTFMNRKVRNFLVVTKK